MKGLPSLEVLSWKPLCVAMPISELIDECWHAGWLKVVNKEVGTIQCKSCGKRWIGVTRWKPSKEL